VRIIGCDIPRKCTGIMVQNEPGSVIVTMYVEEKIQDVFRMTLHTAQMLRKALRTLPEEEPVKVNSEYDELGLLRSTK